MIARIETIVQALGKLEAEYQRSREMDTARVQDHDMDTIAVSVEDTIKNTVKHTIKNTVEDTIKNTVVDTMENTVVDTIQDPKHKNAISVMDGRKNSKTLQRSPLKVRTDVPKTEKKLKTPTEDPEKKRHDNWKRSALMMWQKMLDHRAGNSFMRIPKDLDINLIKEPMCLESIRTRIREGVIKSTPELHRDLTLMLANTVMLYDAESEEHEMALEMLDFVNCEMHNFLIHQR